MVNRKRKILDWGNSILFLGPTTFFFFFVITVIIPFIYGIYLTFHSMSTPTDPLVFSGVENYVQAINDTRFWESLWITIKFVFATTILINIVGFCLAYLVTLVIERAKVQNFLRSAYFTPNLIGGLVLGFIWQFVFVQILPAIGDFTGIKWLELGWLGDPVMAFWRW